MKPRREPRGVALHGGKVFLLAALLTGGAARTSAADRTRDLEAEFHPGGPVLVVHAEARDGPDGGMASARLTLARKGEVPFQVIDVQNAGVSAQLFLSSLALEDLDFDDWTDLRGVADFGAKWGTYQVWLFAARQGKFVENRLARAMGRLVNLTVDPERRELMAFTIGPSQPSRDTFKVEGGKLVTFERCRFDNDQIGQGNVGELVIRRRVDGKLKVVERRTLSTQDQPYLNPCAIPEQLAP
jgi:hypothetical protein